MISYILQEFVKCHLGPSQTERCVRVAAEYSKECRWFPVYEMFKQTGEQFGCEAK